MYKTLGSSNPEKHLKNFLVKLIRLKQNFVFWFCFSNCASMVCFQKRKKFVGAFKYVLFVPQKYKKKKKQTLKYFDRRWTISK